MAKNKAKNVFQGKEKPQNRCGSGDSSVRRLQFGYFRLGSLALQRLANFQQKILAIFFEVLLTQFEPPAEFNADITRPAFGTHPAAILASVLLLSADR